MRRQELQVVHPDPGGGVDHLLEPGGHDVPRECDGQHRRDVGFQVLPGVPDVGETTPVPESHLAGGGALNRRTITEDGAPDNLAELKSFGRIAEQSFRG